MGHVPKHYIGGVFMDAVVKVVLASLAFIDTIFVFYAMRKMYHSLFNIVYIRFQAIITEFIVMMFLSMAVVMGPLALLMNVLYINDRSVTGIVISAVYLLAFFILSVFIIKKYSKKSGGEQ